MKRVPVILLIFSLFAPLATAGEEARGQEFVVNILPSPSNLNPQRISTTNEAQIALALFEGLLTYHPSTLGPMPGVARKWEWNKDYTRITFYLRENARFSDGTPITAAHFRESWLYLIAHNLPYASLLDVITGARALREGKGSPEEVGIVAKDPHTLVLTLTNPAPYILKFLPHTAFAPVASGMDLSRTWAPSRDLVGNGPYRILKVEKDRLVLEKNPQYWDQESVKIPRLVITSYDDPERVMRLFNGDAIHWVADGYDLSLLNNRKALVLNPLFATTFYFFNASTPPSTIPACAGPWPSSYPGTNSALPIATSSPPHTSSPRSRDTPRSRASPNPTRRPPSHSSRRRDSPKAKASRSSRAMPWRAGRRRSTY